MLILCLSCHWLKTRQQIQNGPEGVLVLHIKLLTTHNIIVVLCFLFFIVLGFFLLLSNSLINL